MRQGYTTPKLDPAWQRVHWAVTGNDKAKKRPTIRRVPRGRYVLIPTSDQTHGHGTHIWAAVWKDQLARQLLVDILSGWSIFAILTEPQTIKEASMADKEKSLEMRVAELEDKLAKMHVTEDEMKAYHKVSALMGGGGAAAAGPSPQAGCILDCAISGCISECAIRPCTVVRSCTIRACCIIRACTFECGGGCAPGGGGFSGGGFGSLGG